MSKRLGRHRYILCERATWLLGWLLVLLPLTTTVISCERRKEPITAIPSNSRYQLLTTQGKILKLDTASGQTWTLSGDSIWIPVATQSQVPSAEGRKIREVVERVVEPLIPTMEYDPVSKTLHRISDTAREKRIKSVVQRAWEEYGKVESSFDPKDPLGLLSGKNH